MCTDRCHIQNVETDKFNLTEKYKHVIKHWIPHNKLASVFDFIRRNCILDVER
jgi:hypothetical protein